MKLTAPQYLYDDTTVSEDILSLLLDRRRGLPDEPVRRGPAVLAASTQFKQIMDFVRHGQPIEMTLPAFPCKSPSPAKVAGVLPDEGERLALIELDELCRRIGDLYPPGALVTICSDGHVFGDHIGVDDDTITDYHTELHSMITTHDLQHLAIFDLHSLWPGLSFADKRALLDALWCEPPAVLRARAHTDRAVSRLVAGMSKFLFEDAPGLPGETRSQRQKNAKRRAYHVISRSQGWGKVVSAYFPQHLRLSIHPQPWGAEKLGMRLLRHADTWTTPWHSVVLYSTDGRPHLVRHDEARTRGIAQIRAGRLTHYTAG
ncbi:isocyanide synthase family protein [Rhodococcus erythropolis]|uniref:isocyanide synthase family protein n=1 Tax=Rhodococcus erythropolis TaxID=1833 RepID=UPI00294A73A0|nr:isocyanide synthase family protein [Rhodococcus erythropolis]MDV6278170.1 isocyanide synthase family protein [Rhodococcus erythropolis]